jgi:hypothetical protein
MSRMDGSKEDGSGSEIEQYAWVPATSDIILPGSVSLVVAPVARNVAVAVQFEKREDSDVIENETFTSSPCGTLPDDYFDWIDGTAVAVLPLLSTYQQDQGTTYGVSNGFGRPFFPMEGNESTSVRAAGKKGKAKERLPNPVVDNEYFDTSYKQALVDYWKQPYDKESVLEYLKDGSKQNRGASYGKFASTLYHLGKEFLSPDNFVKHEGLLFKWECKFGMPYSSYSGMEELRERLKNSTKHGESDWYLHEGVSLILFLWDEPTYKKKACWNPWVSVGKSTIDNAGNGLFAAREFQTDETIGFYCGNVIYTYPAKWTEKASDEFLVDRGGVLDDDSRTMSLVNKEGYRVVVNPLYTTKQERIENPPLLMGMHFLNDFNKIYNEQMEEGVKVKTEKFNNVWVDDQGGVKACRRICVGEELFISYEGKRTSYKYKRLKKGTPGAAEASGVATATVATGMAVATMSNVIAPTASVPPGRGTGEVKRTSVKKKKDKKKKKTQSKSGNRDYSNNKNKKKHGG